MFFIARRLLSWIAAGRSAGKEGTSSSRQGPRSSCEHASSGLLLNDVTSRRTMACKRQPSPASSELGLDPPGERDNFGLGIAAQMELEPEPERDALPALVEGGAIGERRREAQQSSIASNARKVPRELVTQLVGRRRANPSAREARSLGQTSVLLPGPALYRFVFRRARAPRARDGINRPCSRSRRRSSSSCSSPCRPTARRSSGARRASARARSCAKPPTSRASPASPCSAPRSRPRISSACRASARRDAARFVTEFCPPRAILRAEPFLLFIDELNSAVPDVQKAFYSLILDRRLGDYELPEGSRVVGAGQPRRGSRAGATDGDGARQSHGARRAQRRRRGVARLGRDARRAPAGPRASFARGPIGSSSCRLRDATPAYPTPRAWHMLSDAHRLGERAALGRDAPRAPSAIAPAPSGAPSPSARSRPRRSKRIAAGRASGPARSRAHLFPRRELPGPPRLERSRRRRARRPGRERARRRLEGGRGVDRRRGALAPEDEERRRSPRSRTTSARAARRCWSTCSASAASRARRDVDARLMTC